MTDKVKLIIEIPEKMYEQIKDGAGENRYKIPLWLCHSIFYGTPLDDVKAEIKTFTIAEKSKYDTGFNDAVLKCFNALDNIGKESEDTKKSCNTCKNSDDEFSGECYECVKNIQNHYEPKSEDK